MKGLKIVLLIGMFCVFTIGFTLTAMADNSNFYGKFTLTFETLGAGYCNPGVVGVIFGDDKSRQGTYGENEYLYFERTGNQLTYTYFDEDNDTVTDTFYFPDDYTIVWVQVGIYEGYDVGWRTELVLEFAEDYKTFEFEGEIQDVDPDECSGLVIGTAKRKSSGGGGGGCFLDLLKNN